MIKEIICSLPLSVKMEIGNMKTIMNNKKRKAIKLIDTYNEKNFPEINNSSYKCNLKKFLKSSAYSAQETEDYLSFLYNDRLSLLHQGAIKKEKPTIICVVKNEYDKLIAFFNHYQKLGDFNYIFIDNLSSDKSIELMISHDATIYQCKEKFSTIRKLAWINKLYSTIQNDAWTLLLDADELLVYDGYEQISIQQVLKRFDNKRIITSAAIMIDMFSKKPSSCNHYLKNYIFFENRFHEEKSYFFKSVYGGIREREFKFGKERIFLLKKHPIVKKTRDCMLIHCHYVYPFKRNFESTIFFGLLHYKLFDSEIEKYKKIAQEESYGDGSIEYKSYLEKFSKKSYEEIFMLSQDSLRYKGTASLKQISCLHDIEEVL